MLPLAIRNNFNSILEPLKGSVVLFNIDFKHCSLILHNIFALQLAGKCVLEFIDFQIANCFIIAFLSEIFNYTFVFTSVCKLGSPNVQSANPVFLFY